MPFLPILFFFYFEKNTEHIKLNMSNLHGPHTQDGRKKKKFITEEVSNSLSLPVPERATVMNLVLMFSVYIFALLLHMWNHK